MSQNAKIDRFTRSQDEGSPRSEARLGQKNQCFIALFIFRSPCDNAIQFFLAALDCFASARNDAERSVENSVSKVSRLLAGQMPQRQTGYSRPVASTMEPTYCSGRSLDWIFRFAASIPRL